MNLCTTDGLQIWKFVGYILFAFKIVIPLLIIVLGMMDLGKAVVGSKDDEIKKATSALVKRAIAGVVIFFIPTLVKIIFNLFNLDETWTNCVDCVTSPSSCNASGDVLKNPGASVSSST